MEEGEVTQMNNVVQESGAIEGEENDEVAVVNNTEEVDGRDDATVSESIEGEKERDERIEDGAPDHADRNVDDALPEIFPDSLPIAESELKPGGNEVDENVELKLKDEEGGENIPVIDSVKAHEFDEFTDRMTVTTEEEFVSNVGINHSGSNSDDESRRHATKDPESSLIHASVDGNGGEEVFTASDNLKESKESLVSKTSSEYENVLNDEENGDASQSVAFQRSEVVEHCKSLLSERRLLRKKNILLHKKLHDYFKKKKAEGTYHEGELSHVGSGSPELHYRKKLLVFEEIQTQVANERIRIENESRELLERKHSVEEESLQQLELLLKQEETLGHGLIDSQTGKTLSNKVTHQLINRQGQIAKKLSEAMLKFIRIRDKVTETEAALKSLEVLGEGLHLIDYEQLRVENRALHDKIEERDNELGRLRKKIETSILTMSHMDEKAFGTDQLVSDSHKQLWKLMMMLKEGRGIKTEAQKRLIYVRSEIQRLYHEAGLLAHHPLLRDFELVLKQVEQLKLEVNQMKKHVIQDIKLSPSQIKPNNTQKIRKISPEMAHKKSISSSIQENKHKRQVGGKSEKIYGELSNQEQSTNHKSKLMKGRPSIVRFLLEQ